MDNVSSYFLGICQTDLKKQFFMFDWIEGSQLCCKMWHGKDSIIYSWQANFLNEPQDCCSLELDSHKHYL